MVTCLCMLLRQEKSHSRCSKAMTNCYASYYDKDIGHDRTILSLHNSLGCGINGSALSLKYMYLFLLDSLSCSERGQGLLMAWLFWEFLLLLRPLLMLFMMAHEGQEGALPASGFPRGSWKSGGSRNRSMPPKV